MLTIKIRLYYNIEEYFSAFLAYSFNTIQGISLVYISVSTSVFWLILSCCALVAADTAAAVTVAAAVAAGDVRLSSGLIEHAAQFFDMFSICLICQVALSSLSLSSCSQSVANGNDMPKKARETKQKRKNPNGFLLPKAFKSETGCQVAGIVKRGQSCLLLRAC